MVIALTSVLPFRSQELEFSMLILLRFVVTFGSCMLNWLETSHW